VGALELGFLSHLLSGLLEERGIEGRAERCTTGETGGTDTVKELGTADTVGAIGEAEGGYALLGDRFGMPEINAFNMVSS